MKATAFTLFFLIFAVAALTQPATAPVRDGDGRAAEPKKAGCRDCDAHGYQRCMCCDESCCGPKAGKDCCCRHVDTCTCVKDPTRGAVKEEL